MQFFAKPKYNNIFLCTQENLQIFSSLKIVLSGVFQMFCYFGSEMIIMMVF